MNEMIELEIRRSAAYAESERAKAKTAEAWRVTVREWIWNAVAAVILLCLAYDARDVWLAALQEPISVSSPREYGRTWLVDGKVRRADHITNTAPDYMGIKGMSVSGFAEDNRLLWTVSGVSNIEERER